MNDDMIKKGRIYFRKVHPNHRGITICLGRLYNFMVAEYMVNIFTLTIIAGAYYQWTQTTLEIVNAIFQAVVSYIVVIKTIFSLVSGNISFILS